VYSYVRSFTRSFDLSVGHNSSSPSLKKSPMKQGENSRHPRTPTQTEGVRAIGCGLLPQVMFKVVKINLYDPWFNHCIFNTNEKL
jgi:hypothetical protein